MAPGAGLRARGMGLDLLAERRRLAVAEGLFLGVALSRRIVGSSFGLALRGIRENLKRMPAIGSDYRGHLQKIYTISAAMAGAGKR